MSGATAGKAAALVTTVQNNIALLGMRLGAIGAQNAAAGILSVTGVNIHVERAKAKRTVIARGIAKGHDLFAAIFAYKAGIVF